MRRTFHIPPRFSPTRSLLGLGVRLLVKDRRQAEGVYLIAFWSLVLLVILAQFVTWTWVEPAIEADAGGPVAVRFFAAQVAGILCVLAVCGVGFASAVRVAVGDTCLTLRQGRRTRKVALEAIEGCVTVSALQFHRDYRPYEAVDAFISRITQEVVVLETAQVQIAIGLRSEDHKTFAALMEEVTVRHHPAPLPAVEAA